MKNIVKNLKQSRRSLNKLRDKIAYYMNGVL